MTGHVLVFLRFMLEHNVTWQHIVKSNGFNFKIGIPPFPRSICISCSSHYRKHLTFTIHYIKSTYAKQNFRS